MPITIAPPLLDQPTGPGFFTAWETDFIGPIAAGSFWRVSFSTVAAPESVLFSYTYGTDQHQFQGVLGAAAGHLDAVATSSNLPAQTPARFLVELVDPFSVVIDTGAKQVVWDPVSGIHSLLPYVSPSVLTGGFNETDRGTLNTVLGSVQVALPASAAGAADVVARLVDLLTGPQRSILHPREQVVIFGRGTLSAQPPGLLYSYGGRWLPSVMPPGYGYRDGVQAEFNNRVVQFVVVRQGGNGVEYIAETVDSFVEQGELLWTFPNPSRIDYDVSPGVTLRWSWLVTPLL